MRAFAQSLVGPARVTLRKIQNVRAAFDQVGLPQNEGFQALVGGLQNVLEVVGAHLVPQLRVVVFRHARVLHVPQARQHGVVVFELAVNALHGAFAGVVHGGIEFRIHFIQEPFFHGVGGQPVVHARLLHGETLLLHVAEKGGVVHADPRRNVGVADPLLVLAHVIQVAVGAVRVVHLNDRVLPVLHGALPQQHGLRFHARLAVVRHLQLALDFFLQKQDELLARHGLLLRLVALDKVVTGAVKPAVKRDVHAGVVLQLVGVGQVLLGDDNVGALVGALLLRLALLELVGLLVEQHREIKRREQVQVQPGHCAHVEPGVVRHEHAVHQFGRGECPAQAQLRIGRIGALERGVAGNVVLLLGKAVRFKHAVAAEGSVFGVRLAADQQVVQQGNAQVHDAVVVGAHLVALGLEQRVVALVVADALAQEGHHVGVLSVRQVAMVHHEGFQVIHDFGKGEAAHEVFFDEVKQDAGARHHDAQVLGVAVGVRDFGIQHVLLDVAQKVAGIEGDVLVQVVNGARADARGLAQELPVIQVVMVQQRLVQDVDGVQVDARKRHGGLGQHDERLQRERVGGRHGHHVGRHAVGSHGNGVQAREPQVVALHDKAAGLQVLARNHGRLEFAQVVNRGFQIVAHGRAVQVIFLVFGRGERRELGRAHLVHVSGVRIGAGLVSGVQLGLLRERLGHRDLNDVLRPC